MAITVAKETPDLAPDGLKIVVSEDDARTTITLIGEWDLASQTTSREVIRTALQRHPECVVLDLSALTFIDSTGLRVAVELHKCARQQNTRLVIVPGCRAVQRLFEICQLTEVLPFAAATQD
jgi:anti-anti-sigma factor